MKRADPYPGLHRAPKTLASGAVKVYFYAWQKKPGQPKPPRLPDDYGSPAFAAAFRDAIASRAPGAAGATVQTIFDGYQRSRSTSKSKRGFQNLARRTQIDYAGIMRGLEREFGDMPLAALADPAVRGVFLDWRDRRAAVAPRRADYEFSVLARILAWALDRRLILANPCEKAGRVWHGSRAAIIWSDDDEAAFYRAAPPYLHIALTLGLWTGQRQGDLLRLPWSAYDGETVRLRQSKTGAHVAIPAGAPLRAALDAMPRRSPIIVTNNDGAPWAPGPKRTHDGFRKAWTRAMKAAGVEGVTFNDLRGTTVTRLRGMGRSHAEIGAITGHSNAEISAILEKHYAAHDPNLARAAVKALEDRAASPNRLPNRTSGTGGEA